MLLELLLGHPLRRLNLTPLQAITMLSVEGSPNIEAPTMAANAADPSQQATTALQPEQPEGSTLETSLGVEQIVRPTIAEPVPESLRHVLRRALAEAHRNQPLSNTVGDL